MLRKILVVLVGVMFLLSGDFALYARCKKESHLKKRRGKIIYICAAKSTQNRKFKKNNKCKYCGCAKSDHTSD
jgi:hypothetical protein